ncbi:MAG: type II toxin-antitoxin system prevent-host-death family antitoxin [Propionibacteriaceae bacterium]|jgi:prevent-host-death family protein|nr:type II toxin-antitoxin system prevent-host-death family antitoxin [Propionibacteriaceae bacterium]
MSAPPVEVGVYDAKTHLSKLLDMVASGTDVVITRNGSRAALLTAVPDAPAAPRPFGLFPDYVIDEEWKAWTDDDEQMWYGN